ncbi:MAG: T9SS type A sorting domain-containing protein [Ignavibacteriaceae bacterium]
MKALCLLLLAVFFTMNNAIGQSSKAKSLAIGNKWTYFIYHMIGSINQYHVFDEVIKDTIIDQKVYAIIKSTSSWSGTSYSYQRADSIRIYQYIPSVLSPQYYPVREDTLVDFSLNIGDSLMYYVITNKLPGFFFGKFRLKIRMYLDHAGLFSFDDEYAEEIGLIYRFYDFPGDNLTSELKAAKIENIIYGDSALVNIEKHEQLLPLEFEMSQNYPNPFNPSTVINFSVPKQSYVRLLIYDALGREVTTLINEEKPIGNYTVEYNAANLSSGIYFYQLRADEFIRTKKMLLLR